MVVWVLDCSSYANKGCAGAQENYYGPESLSSMHMDCAVVESVGPSAQLASTFHSTSYTSLLAKGCRGAHGHGHQHVGISR
jgi:hypothetical protein